MLVLGFLTATSAFLVLVFVEPGGAGQLDRRLSSAAEDSGDHGGSKDVHRQSLLPLTDHQQRVSP